MEFTNSGLDALPKNLSEMNFKYLSQEFSGNLLKIYSLIYVDGEEIKKSKRSQ